MCTKNLAALLLSLALVPPSFGGEFSDYIHGANARAGNTPEGAGWVKPTLPSQYHYDVHVEKDRQTARVEMRTGPKTSLKGPGEVTSLVQDVKLLNDQIQSPDARLSVVRIVNQDGRLIDEIYPLKSAPSDLTGLQRELEELKSKGDVRRLQYEVPLDHQGKRLSLVKSASEKLKERMRIVLAVDPGKRKAIKAAKTALRNRGSWPSKVMRFVSPLTTLLGTWTIGNQIRRLNPSTSDQCGQGKVLCDRLTPKSIQEDVVLGSSVSGGNTTVRADH